MALTKFPNGMKTFVVDSNAVERTANYTVVVTTDSGKTFASKLDGIVFTLPSIAIGNTYTFVNMALDGQASLSISPAAADGITYAGSEVDNKDLVLAKATSKQGDYVTIASLNGLVAWQVVEARGVWTKEA